MKTAAAVLLLAIALAGCGAAESDSDSPSASCAADMLALIATLEMADDHLEADQYESALLELDHAERRVSAAAEAECLTDAEHAEWQADIDEVRSALEVLVELDE